MHHLTVFDGEPHSIYFTVLDFSSKHFLNIWQNTTVMQYVPFPQSMDSEREKFRTYIEKTGVMSALTEALVQLYEEQERPSDALGHIKKTLGSVTPSIQHCHMLEETVG